MIRASAGVLIAALALAPGGCRCADEERQHQLDRIEQLEWERRAAADWLPGLLDHEQGPVRARACLAAGRLGSLDPGVLSALERRLADDDAAVRGEAGLALELVLASLPPDWVGRDALASRFAVWLQRQLRREQVPVARRQLLQALGSVSPARTPTLQLLAGELQRPDTRDTALAALARGGGRLPAELAPGLTGVLRGHSAAQAALAVAARGGTTDRRLLAALLAAGARANAGTSLERWATRAVAQSEPATQLDWLVQRSRDADPAVQTEAVRGMAAAGEPGARRLVRRLRQMWRSVSANHFRLTGATLKPVLAGLDALIRHAGMPEVGALAREMLELADASDAAVSYGEKEAHAVDQVHCAAARLLDLGQGKLEHAASCGTAGSRALTPALRAGYVLDVVLGLGSRAGDDLVRTVAGLLGSQDPETRAAAGAALARSELPRGVAAALAGALGRALLADDPLTVAAVAAALARHHRELRRQPPLVRGLVQATKRVDPRLQPRAACELARAVAALLPRQQAGRLLKPLVHASVTGVRRCAHAALKRDGAPAWVAGQPPFERPTDSLPRRAKVVTNRGVFYMQLAGESAPGAVTRLLEPDRYRGALVRGDRAGLRVRLPPGDAPPPLPAELGEARFVAGSVALLAPAGRDTAQGDLLLLLERRPELDGQLTLVGQVEPAGMKVVQRLQPGDRISGIYGERPPRSAAAR